MRKKIVAIIAAIVCLGSAAMLVTSCGKSDDTTDPANITDTVVPTDSAITE